MLCSAKEITIGNCRWPHQDRHSNVAIQWYRRWWESCIPLNNHENFPRTIHSVIQNVRANVYLALLISTLSPSQLTLIYKHKQKREKTCIEFMFVCTELCQVTLQNQLHMVSMAHLCVKLFILNQQKTEKLLDHQVNILA